MAATKTIEHKGRVTKATVKYSTICLAMMASREGDYFQRIADELGDRISAWTVIVDPGDEATGEAAEKAFGHLPGKVHVLPFIQDKFDTGHGDYGANRNRMLELARQWECDYVLWLDPDDPLVGTIPDVLTEPLYVIEIQAEGTSWGVEHLIHKDTECHWEAPIHEHLIHEGTSATMLSDCYLDRSGGSGSHRTNRIETKAIPLLLKMIEENGQDGHAWYYLAQSYRDSGHRNEAVAAFDHRAKMGGFDQAVYWCRFQVAEMTGNPDDYLTAWNCRPQRLEALHRLAAFYNARGQYVVGRMFAMIGLGIKPTDDAMFVERWVEEYGLLSEFAVAEFYLGNTEKADRAWEFIESLGDAVRPEHKILFRHNRAEMKEPGSGELTSSYDRAFMGKGVTIGEGSISAQQAHYLSELVKGHDGPMKIAETGFGLGWSSWAFLEGNPETTVTSFDLVEYEGVKQAKAIVDEHFPGRHTLIPGDSKKTVPKHQDDWDLVYIDGGHDYESAMADLKNFAKPGRMVVFDDVVDATWAGGCLRAWNEAIAADGFVDLKLESRDGPHAWSTGVYR